MYSGHRPRSACEREATTAVVAVPAGSAYRSSGSQGGRRVTVAGRDGPAAAHGWDIGWRALARRSSRGAWIASVRMLHRGQLESGLRGLPAAAHEAPRGSLEWRGAGSPCPGWVDARRPDQRSTRLEPNRHDSERRGSAARSRFDRSRQILDLLHTLEACGCGWVCVPAR